MTHMDDFKAQCTALSALQKQELSKTRPVWIFGAGQFGRDLCAVLRKLGYEISGFIETKPKQKDMRCRYSFCRLAGF